MRLAVLSDIHDHVWNLGVALDFLKDCDQMICCGDLCSPFIIDQLAAGFSGPIHIVWGNNDADRFRMTAKLGRYPHIQLRGEFFDQAFDNRRIAVNHFDSIGVALAEGGLYDAVFFGHNHRFECRHTGPTLALNPGSILGAQFDAGGTRTDVPPSFAIYDTAAGDVQAFEIALPSTVRPRST